jgi:DNA mismatch endonuclease (patch repair protein)
MDIVSKEVRSQMMAAIRSKNTSPEIRVRKLLHRNGFRYRLHPSELPGKPDIILPRYRVCIFVQGCFWHRHPGCKYSTTPKTREDFWATKFDQNSARDHRNQGELLRRGWRVIEIWECGIRKPHEELQWLIEVIPDSSQRYISWPVLLSPARPLYQQS